jgi:hypothetical protein
LVAIRLPLTLALLLGFLTGLVGLPVLMTLTGLASRRLTRTGPS